MRLLPIALLLACQHPKSSNNNPTAPSGPTGTQAGIAVPQELSAVPPTQGAARQDAGPVAPTMMGTDYDNDVTIRDVHEASLDKFDTVTQMLKALGQTHYADPANVGAGPYKAIVTRDEVRGNVTVTTQEPWVIDSKMVDGVNHIDVWLQVTGANGSPVTQIVSFDITTPPTQNADGSYATYGQWHITMNAGTLGSFSADAKTSAAGESVVTLLLAPGSPLEVRGIMHKSANSGFGKLSFQGVVTEYAYDGDALALKAGTGPVTHKQRSNPGIVVLEYGVYDKDTHENARTLKTFGFPFSYSGGFGYYGMYNGQHQVWGQMGDVPAGTPVVRTDRLPTQTMESYTVGTPFIGVFTKSTLIPAKLGDVKGLLSLIIGDIYTKLLFENGTWNTCSNLNLSTVPPVCNGTLTPFTQMAQYQYDPAGFPRFNGPYNPKTFNLRLDNPFQSPVYVFYDAQGPQGDGFYAQLNDSPPMIGTTLLAPTGGALLEANVIGQDVLELVNTTWTRRIIKTVDPVTLLPIFDPAQDTPYTLQPNTSFYVQSGASEYLVAVAADSTVTVSVAQQTLATPGNASTFVAAGTVFVDPAAPTGPTYTFDTTAGSTTYLQLVDASSHALVQTRLVGLIGMLNGSDTGQRFDWSYDMQAAQADEQVFLKNADGSLHFLDAPVHFQPLTINSESGDSRTVLLVFDGQLSGLPTFNELFGATDYPLTDDVAQRMIAIPAGTELTDAAGGIL